MHCLSLEHNKKNTGPPFIPFLSALPLVLKPKTESVFFFCHVFSVCHASTCKTKINTTLGAGIVILTDKGMSL